MTKWDIASDPDLMLMLLLSGYYDGIDTAAVLYPRELVKAGADLMIQHGIVALEGGRVVPTKFGVALLKTGLNIELSDHRVVTRA